MLGRVLCGEDPCCGGGLDGEGAVQLGDEDLAAVVQARVQALKHALEGFFGFNETANDSLM